MASGCTTSCIKSEYQWGWVWACQQLESYSESVGVDVSSYSNRAITPRLTIFVSFDGVCFHAVYMNSNKLRELKEKTQNLPGFRQFFAKKLTKSEGQNNGNSFVWGE